MERSEELKLVAQVTVFHNQRAFEKLVREYQSPVRRFFLSQLSGDGPLSDDLAQDTFIRAYTHLSQFRGQAGLLTWLYRIAYNVLYDYTRQHKDTAPIESRAVAGKQAAASDANLRIDLYEALNVLSPPERTCVSLQLMEGQPIERIADITQMPPNTVKSHLARGKKKLADYLRANGYD
jgi:RNA polymerase sigma-70 factor (ECF subfamily)